MKTQEPRPEARRVARNRRMAFALAAVAVLFFLGFIGRAALMGV